MTDFRNNPKYQFSRALRNNNPMNIRPFKIIYNGQIGVDNGGMAIFKSAEYGLRAGANELVVNYVKHGLNTLTKMINDFAPPFENDTVAYINHVSKLTGLKPNEVFELSEKNVKNLMKAIVKHEDSKGSVYITDKMIDDGIKLLQSSFITKTAAGAGVIIGFAMLIYFLSSRNN